MPKGDGTGPRGKGSRTGQGRGKCRGRRGSVRARGRGNVAGDTVSRLETWGAAIGTLLGIVASVLKLLSSEKRDREGEVIDVTPEKKRLG
ncbi:DUF5320 family protein [Elusimicrobiota bacterium]